MATVKVQECGCIALPQEIVEKTSLYPGAILDIAMTPDGGSIQLVPLMKAPRPTGPQDGATCG